MRYSTSKKRKPNKYKAQPEWVDGHKFDSAGEASRYRDLKLLERAGEIEGLELQPKFPFVIDGRPVLIKSKGYPNGRRASYRADFRYLDKRSGRKIVEDFKGHDTSESRLRRALVECIYGVEIIIIERKRNRSRPKRPGSVQELRSSGR